MPKDESRIRCGIRDVSPCKGCTERFTACSDRCPKDERGDYGHDAWIAKLREVQANRKAYNSLNRRKKWQRTNT
jgi:hypothetical protein